MEARRPAGAWTTIESRRVYFERLPAGPAGADRTPLVLLHGLSCCTATWAPLVEILAARPEAPPVIIPDLPAHGRSEKPGAVLSMDDYGAWAARLMERLELPGIDVMGHSMGCQIALALAARERQRVRRAILLGPTTGGRHVSTLRSLAGLTLDSLREPLSYNATLVRVFLRMGPARYARTVMKMQADDAFRRAGEVACPTLVAQGSRDAIVPVEAATGLALALRTGEYARIEGAAHAAQYSHPDRTAAEVLRFLA